MKSRGGANTPKLGKRKTRSTSQESNQTQSNKHRSPVDVKKQNLLTYHSNRLEMEKDFVKLGVTSNKTPHRLDPITGGKKHRKTRRKNSKSKRSDV